VLVAANCLLAQVPGWEWVRDPLEKRQQSSQMSTAYDNSGNTYSAGTVMDIAIFGDQVLDLDEGYQYIWKVNAAGNSVWVKAFNYPSCFIQDLDTDSIGNLYVLVRYYDFIEIEGTDLNPGWNHDLFVAKINSNGDFMWISEAGGLNSFDARLKVTPNGVSYITGTFTGYISIAGQDYEATESDIFLARIDSSGFWAWSRRVIGLTEDNVYALDVDSLGNCYLAGDAGNAIQFGAINIPFVGYMPTVFVAKCNSSGSWLWAQSVYPASSTYLFGSVWDIAASSSGSCYLAHYEYISGVDRVSKITAFTATGTPSLLFSATGPIFFEGLETDAGNNLYLYGTRMQPVSFGDFNFDTMVGTFFVKFNANGQAIWAEEPSSALLSAGQFHVAANGTALLGIQICSSAAFGDFYCSPSSDSSIYFFRLSNTGQPLWMKTNWLNSIRSEVKGLDVDGYLNIYITGEFEGDTYIGEQYLPNHSSIGKDIYVAKLSPQGEWLWAVSVGGSGLDEVVDISVGSGMTPYITGHFSGQVDFGGTILTSEGETDIFIAKLDTNGNWLWAKRAGGMGVDKAKDMYPLWSVYPVVTGFFNGTADFGNVKLHSAGLEDVFVCSIYPDGTWNNATRVGGIASDVGTALVACDDYIVLGGNFSQEITFGSNTLVSVGGSDIFVAELSPLLNWDWAYRAGGVENDELNSMSWGPFGNIYLTGAFRETAQFGDTILSSLGDSDIFVGRMSWQNGWIWARSAGGVGSDAGASITGNSQTVMISGWTTGESFFGEDSFAGFGGKDLMIAGIDELSGDWEWSKRSGGLEDEWGYVAKIDPCNRMLIGGYYESNAYFQQHQMSPQGIGQGFFGLLNSALENIDPAQTPNLSQIESVYPNPFNPCTTIQYSLKQAGSTTLTIYNLKGQKVNLLVNQVNSAGKHNAVWDGTDDNGKAVSSGVYFLRLEQGGYRDMRKLMLLK